MDKNENDEIKNRLKVLYFEVLYDVKTLICVGNDQKKQNYWYYW